MFPCLAVAESSISLKWEMTAASVRRYFFGNLGGKLWYGSRLRPLWQTWVDGPSPTIAIIHSIGIDRASEGADDENNYYLLLCDSAEKEAKQSSMMDLEIADYERTVQTLTDQIASRDNALQALRNESAILEQSIASVKSELEAVETQRGQAEERSNKMKQLLMKTKKELADAKKMVRLWWSVEIVKYSKLCASQLRKSRMVAIYGAGRSPKNGFTNWHLTNWIPRT